MTPPAEPTGGQQAPYPPPPSAADAVPQTGTAWYNGPLPISGLVQKESVGAAMGRTAVKAITALVVFGVGLFIIPFMFIAILAAIGGAAGGANDLATPTTLVAGESDADLKLVAVGVTGLILGEDRDAGGGGLFAPTNVTYG